MSVTTSRRLAAVALTALAVSIVDAAPVAAAAAAADNGYVRLAHLSPDTPRVDVYLSSPTGAIGEQRFNGVGYGDVSGYNRLPTGSYAVAMRAAGASPTTDPVITTQVTVAAGRAYTVAGVGRFADLGLRIIEDDLALPPGGKAKVRIIQASVRAPVLGVSTAAGQSIATDVAFATTTPYRVVEPGLWTVNLQPAGGGKPSTLRANCRSGNVYSLIVVDAPDGRLKAELRPDATREGGIPVGGVDTGGGGTAARDGAAPGGKPVAPASSMLAGALLALGLAGVVVATRLRRPRRS